MVNDELQLPAQAFVNKFIAKSKFYERANLSSRLHKEFVEKIQRITWKYKLAEETIGVEKTDVVTEIQIFDLELKTQEIPEKALIVIDNTISYQILYRFIFNNSISWGITLKEGTKAGNYYFSEWNQHMYFDFTGITLEKIYQKIVKAFIKVDSDKKHDFKELIANDNNRKQLENEISTLKRKIKREKQFNRKVEINKVLLMKKQQLKNVLNHDSE